MKAETNILGWIPWMVEMKIYYWMDIRKRSSSQKRKVGAGHHYLTQILVWFGKWFIAKIQRNKFMMELNGTLQKWTNIFRLHFLLWVRLQFYCPTIPLFRGTYVVIVEPWDNLLIEAQIWSPFTQLAILSDKIKLVAIQDLTGIHNCAWVWCPYKLWSIHDFKLSK